jgi:phosphopantetheinyl transferase
MDLRTRTVEPGALGGTPSPGRWAELAAVFWLIQRSADVPPDDEWLAPTERETLAALRSVKRRRDWRLGRWTVKQALVELARGSAISIRDPAHVIIRTYPSGAPYCCVNGCAVPWSISISHSHDRGLCAIAPAATAVGCDIEREEPRIDGFTREWFTRSEQDVIARTDAKERHRTVTLFWSAKESALKVIGAGLTMSTHDVTVTADDPRLEDEWSSLSVTRRDEAEAMRGWWRRDGGDVITIVTAPALGRPFALNVFLRQN